MPRIAIVGRGFSGMMTAIALMKTVRAPFHLQLFDPNSSVSGGRALASARSSTILNTRVRDLSVSVGDNDDFNDWLCSNAAFRAAVPAAIPGFRQIFVPKEIFSDYVYQRWKRSPRAGTSPSSVCNDPVVAIRRSHGHRFLLESANPANPLFDTVILATGYGLTAPDAGGEDVSPIRAQRLIARPHAVLLGSGIRVVDQLLQLRRSWLCRPCGRSFQGAASCPRAIRRIPPIRSSPPKRCPRACRRSSASSVKPVARPRNPGEAGNR
ncbi:FAD/NAD(P)-binding protein (plasmid) [Rhizobium johnstonii]|nr:FAD/NAD(P)-binding protein [Rhizobium johnstonii]